MKAFSLFIDKKQIFLKNPITKNQKPKQKQNVNFPALPIQKFHGLVLGIVGLIDAKGH